MQKVECPRKSERRIGMLESFNPRPGQSCAYVRAGGDLFHVTLGSRGVLQQDGSTIVHCVNGDRYNPIEPGTLIAIDVVFDIDGKKPIPGLWAPKTVKP